VSEGYEIIYNRRSGVCHRLPAMKACRLEKVTDFFNDYINVGEELLIFRGMKFHKCRWCYR